MPNSPSHSHHRAQEEEEDSYSASWRKWAALLAAGTLAWDYYRDQATFTSFSHWALLLHFVYFQLPLRSIARAYLHSTSFISAFSIPALYICLLVWKPSLEDQHMELWSMDRTAVFVRAFLINFAPLLLHMLELSFHRPELVRAYSSRPAQVMFIWPLVSFTVLFVAFDFTFPSTEDTEDLGVGATDDLARANKLISLSMLAVAYAALYVTVLHRAYAQGADGLADQKSR